MRKILFVFGLLTFVSGTVLAEDSPAPAIQQSVEKSLDLLQRSGVEFFKKSGCISCHHQSLAAMAVSAARERGFRVNEEIAGQQLRANLSVFSPHRETLLQAVPTVPASSIVSTYALIGLAAEGFPGNNVTDAMVHELAQKQSRDGRWDADTQRPPLDQGDITATALSMRSLQLYPLPGRQKEFEERVSKAREWLVTATAVTMQDKTMRLFGLTWAKADNRRIREAAHAVLAEQRPDGGWSQLPKIESDAYATGQALVALYESGVLAVTDSAYQRGVRFLLETQAADGSWHVKSRSLGFQPYFESGYPYGHDQWISAAGGAWATMALALTAPQQVASAANLRGEQGVAR